MESKKRVSSTSGTRKVSTVRKTSSSKTSTAKKTAGSVAKRATTTRKTTAVRKTVKSPSTTVKKSSTVSSVKKTTAPVSEPTIKRVNPSIRAIGPTNEKEKVAIKKETGAKSPSRMGTIKVVEPVKSKVVYRETIKNIEPIKKEVIKKIEPEKIVPKKVNVVKETPVKVETEIKPVRIQKEKELSRTTKMPKVETDRATKKTIPISKTAIEKALLTKEAEEAKRKAIFDAIENKNKNKNVESAPSKVIDSLSSQRSIAPVSEAPKKEESLKKSVKVKKKVFNRKIRFAIAALILIVYYTIIVLFVKNLSNLNILDTKWIIIISIILFVISFLMTFKLLRKKTRGIPWLIFAIITIILCIGFSFGNKYILSTSDFLRTITTEEEEITKNFVVVALKNSKITGFEELKNEKIGYLEMEPEAIEKITFAHGEVSSYASVLVIAKDLIDGKIKAGVFSDSFMDLLKEMNEEVYNKLTVISSYEAKVKNEAKSSTEKAKKSEGSNVNPFVLYIIGSDSRGALSSIARNDVNILAAVNPKTHKIALVHIPRDYYVQLAGISGSKDKLTHAGYYGTSTAIKTVTNFSGIGINYYVKVGFGTIIKTVDLLGGVNIYSDKTFWTKNQGGCHFNTGWNWGVNGTCALAFSRERYTYKTADRHRGENQEQVIQRIIEKATSKEILAKYSSVLESLKGTFVTNFSYDDITSLIKEQISSMKSWNIITCNMDGTGTKTTTYSLGDTETYVMIPNEATISSARGCINSIISGK